MAKRRIQRGENSMKPVESAEASSITRVRLQDQFKVYVATAEVYLAGPHASTCTHAPDLAGKGVEPCRTLGGSQI